LVFDLLLGDDGGELAGGDLVDVIVLVAVLAVLLLAFLSLSSFCIYSSPLRVSLSRSLCHILTEGRVLPAPQAQLRVSQQMAEEETAEWRQQKELIVRPQPLSARAFCASFLPSLLSWKTISVKLLFVRRCSLLRFGFRAAQLSLLTAAFHHC